jgi:hypothetical protein
MEKVMRAFVINLDDRPDRMVLFNKNEFPFPVERVSAVKRTVGSEGCVLSHFSIMEKQKEFPFVIFEDDCVLLKPWSFIEEAMKQLPPDWDALWLGGTLDAPLTRYSENLFRLRKVYCTHAIIYNSPTMIEYILNNFVTSSGRKIIDVFYYRDVQERFNCFLTYPMTTMQAGGHSDVMGRMQDESDQKWRVNCYNKYTRDILR